MVSIPSCVIFTFCSLLASCTWNALRSQPPTLPGTPFSSLCVFMTLCAPLSSQRHVCSKRFCTLFSNPVRYEFILQLPYFVVTSRLISPFFRWSETPPHYSLLGGSTHSLSLTLLSCHQPPSLVFLFSSSLNSLNWACSHYSWTFT